MWKTKWGQDYYRRKPWAKTAKNISSRIINRPSYNGIRRKINNYLRVADLEHLWVRDKAFLMESPSIDRIDAAGDYSFENCRYIELAENLRRRKAPFNSKIKRLYGYSLRELGILLGKNINTIYQLHKRGEIERMLNA